ncbi:formyltransferase family protein [Campylobacter concisus]|uniref:formyltransferase family protein n=1 Tax=Campylobacter concisus TaxID=199 RepID=UPI000D2FC54E|nr:formyltransferase family protein [Campylobacter concisus]
MKILFLSEDKELAKFLEEDSNTLVKTIEKIDEEFVLKNKIDFILSYGYRYILPYEVLRHFSGRAINLHISLLPYNRGADPNFWSFVDNTPKGVSIHYMDTGLDTGKVIAQKKINFDASKESFATSYNTLQVEIRKLFKSCWQEIKALKPADNSSCQAIVNKGTYHRVADKEKYMYLLKDGWDTNIAYFLNRIKNI